MVDFTSQRYMLGNHANWSSRFAAEDEQAHQAWQRNEERRRYDESTRLAREAAGLEGRIQQQQAGLFNESELTGLVRNPAATPTAASAAVSAPVNGAGVAVPTTQAPTQPVTPITGSNEAPAEYFQNTPIDTRNMTPEQQRVWTEYVHATREFGLFSGHRNFRSDVDQRRVEDITNRLRSLGIEIEYGRPVRRSTRSAEDIPAGMFTWPQNEEQQGSDFTGPGLAAAGAGLADSEPDIEAELGQNFQGINDTTRPLQPTREMRMAAANIAADRQRAELYARHGRPDLAAETFARSLQGQASLITAERQVLYRAAANGSLGAMQRLMEVYNGYPQGTVRMSLTGPNNSLINIEYQMEDGSWVPHGSPMPRDRVLGSLLNLVDAEGAAARNEANQEYMVAVLNNQTDLAEAGIVARTAHDRMFTDLQIAQMNNDMRRAIAEGQATVVNNDETGTTRIFYPRFVNGRTIWEMEEITTETQRSPDTQGEREIQVPVRRRVTGNVGAN